MRIVGGRHRGKSLISPSGHATRPTSDRARQAVFNILEHAGWAPGLDGVRVIDLFAGSGALGLEALSRGALFCLFVETDAGARGAIQENIEALDFFGQARVHRRDATDLGAKPASDGEAFDLAFLDPPYGKDLVPRALSGLVAGGWLSHEAIVVAETGADEVLAAPEGFETIDERLYGAAKIHILRRA